MDVAKFLESQADRPRESPSGLYTESGSKFHASRQNNLRYESQANRWRERPAGPPRIRFTFPRRREPKDSSRCQT